MVRNEFPLVSLDFLFGDVTRRFWLGEYKSIAAVEQDVVSRLGCTVGGGEDRRQNALIKNGCVEDPMLIAECEEFIANQARGSNC